MHAPTITHENLPTILRDHSFEELYAASPELAPTHEAPFRRFKVDAAKLNGWELTLRAAEFFSEVGRPMLALKLLAHGVGQKFGPDPTDLS